MRAEINTNLLEQPKEKTIRTKHKNGKKLVGATALAVSLAGCGISHEAQSEPKPININVQILPTPITPEALTITKAEKSPSNKNYEQKSIVTESTPTAYTENNETIYTYQAPLSEDNPLYIVSNNNPDYYNNGHIHTPTCGHKNKDWFDNNHKWRLKAEDTYIDTKACDQITKQYMLITPLKQVDHQGNGYIQTVHCGDTLTNEAGWRNNQHININTCTQETKHHITTNSQKHQKMEIGKFINFTKEKKNGIKNYISKKYYDIKKDSKIHKEQNHQYLTQHNGEKIKNNTIHNSINVYTSHISEKHIVGNNTSHLFNETKTNVQNHIPLKVETYMPLHNSQINHTINNAPIHVNVNTVHGFNGMHGHR